MDEAELRSDLATGETPSIEFKRCGNSVGRDTFETICSFANSFGGSIYLGVEDDGNAIGIPEENIVPVKRNVTNVVHNPNVFDPPATLEFEDIVFEGSSLVRIWIPPSPSIHRYKGRIFERKGVARRTAQRELAALAQQGTLQAKGNGRARKYFLP